MRAFQEADPHLDNDGILGRATMQSIDRKLEAGTSVAAGGAGMGFGFVGQFMSTLHWIPAEVTYALFAAAGLAALYLIWKYRTAFEAKARQMLGV